MLAASEIQRVILRICVRRIHHVHWNSLRYIPKCPIPHLVKERYYIDKLIPIHLQLNAARECDEEGELQVYRDEPVIQFQAVEQFNVSPCSPTGYENVWRNVMSGG